MRFLAFLAVLLVPAAPAALGGSSADDAPAIEWFETKVRPILVDHCYTCHSADTKPAGGLRVDDQSGLLTGGNTGPAVVPGNPQASLLLKRVTHSDAKRRMPKEGQPLSTDEIAALTRWIREGAHWPRVKVPAALLKPKEWYQAIRKEHWAWQPLTDPKLPDVREGSWPQDELDRFVLAGLEAAGLEPAPDADKVALLRRVTFDLTGLPPTPAEIDAFVERWVGRRAGERVVDRLLASPHFGERWGRHWLDVARYAESTGPSRNIPYPHAWRYRDYVIDAFNADMPFDRFILEQIAGDLLPASSAADRDRLLTATGFLAVGVKDVNQRFKVRFVMDNVDDQIDAVSRVDPGADGELRPLPRPQVRPDPDHGLLRPGRHLHQHRQLRRRAQQDGRWRARLLRHVHAREAFRRPARGAGRRSSKISRLAWPRRKRPGSRSAAPRRV